MTYTELKLHIKDNVIEPDDAYYALLVSHYKEILAETERVSHKTIMEELNINNPSTTSTIIKMLKGVAYEQTINRGV